ncbi:MAG: hypothetical protein ACYTGG_08350 [Planctomycetota bacterium]|jgi:hypothetical protein
MKSNDRVWKLIAIAFVAALFYVGTGLHDLAGGESITPRANAELIGGALTQDAEDVLITSSACGRALYIWTLGDWHLNDHRMPRLKRIIDERPEQVLPDD